MKEEYTQLFMNVLVIHERDSYARMGASTENRYEDSDDYE